MVATHQPLAEELPALGHHHAPLGRRRPHPEPQEAQRCRREDDQDDVRGEEDDRGRQRVGQDVAEEDAPPGEAQRPPGRDVVEVPLPQHLAAHEPRVRHPLGRADRDEDVDLARAQERDDGDDQHEEGHRGDHVHGPHDDGVDPSPVVARSRAEQRPEHEREHGRQDADAQIDRRPGEDPGQHVAPEVVGAEGMGARSAAAGAGRSRV